jgi:hypothetical protein
MDALNTPDRRKTVNGKNSNGARFVSNHSTLPGGQALKLSRRSRSSACCELGQFAFHLNHALDLTARLGNMAA